MENQFGTENLDFALESLGNLAESFDQALEDKKIKPLEWVKIGSNLFPIVKCVKKADDIFNEATDMTDEEKVASGEKFAAGFDLRNDATEELVEGAIQILIQLSDWIKLFKDSKNVPEKVTP